MPGSTAEALLINTIFSAALEKKASDIHLMAGNYPIFRKKDSLHVLAEKQVLTTETLQALVDEILSEDEVKILSSEREVRSVYVWANRARFRASVYYQHGYPAFSFRLIPGDIPRPKDLLVPETVIERSQRRQGLVLLCGPFNSGRTTTMTSLLQNINATASRRIMTIERPVEYLLVNSKSLINQREVGRDTPSFIHGVDDALDADVDVVGISEMLEPGIHEKVLTLAESGKLVFAIMNASSAISALEKFITSISEEKRQWAKDSLSSLLLAIVNQRLVARDFGRRYSCSWSSYDDARSRIGYSG